MNRLPLQGPGSRIHIPAGDFVLGTDAAAGPGTAQFRVPTPSARVRTKIAVFWEPVPAAGIAIPVDLTGVAHTLWMGAEEYCSGPGRWTGWIPVTDVIVNPSSGVLITRNTPMTIPLNSKLMGYGQEFETLGDAIFGELVFNHVVAFQGRWMLQVRYEATQLILDKEWEAIVALCTPQVLQKADLGTIS